MTGLCQIIYCSRSHLKGSPPQMEQETRRILATARVNNQKAGVTGAMTFNEIAFAQVLEGESADVMPIFEKIRRDPRHGDLKILSQINPKHLVFPSWSMAYVGVDTPRNHSRRHPLAHFDFEAALTHGASPQAEQLLTCLRQVIVAKSKLAAG
jgi:hypothetical protein